MPHKDPEAKKAYFKAYNAKRRVEKLAAAKAYYVSHLEQVRVYKKAHRAAHAEEIRAKKKAYYTAHADAINARTRAERAANHEEYLAKKRAYRAARQHELAVQERAYRRMHAAKYRALKSAYNKAHPEQRQAAAKRRSAQKRGAGIRDFTAAQWRTMQEAYAHCCAYCGKRAKGHLTQDHITPLAKGGNHTMHNIVPACRNCNSSKGAGPLPSPVQPLLL